MNRSVYVFVTVTILVSVLNVAHAETMEERKQRIMRKYMRERQDIVQSDLGLSAAVEEDARVVESEQFKELLPEFERQKGGTMPRVIQPNQPVPVQSERNWWLETAEMDTESFDNPFSSKSDTEEGATGSWSPWGRREDSSIYGNAYGQQRDGQEGRREDSSIYGDAYGQQRDGRRGDTYPGAWSAYGMPGESGNRASGSGMTYDGYTTRRVPTSRANDRSYGFYGQQQSKPRGTWGLNSGDRYGSAPSSGLPQSSFPPSSTAQDWSAQSQVPGYTPYRSPYQDQGNEQQRSGSNLQPQQPQYSRPNNYQKWKDNNKAWDPTSDNSYLDELMRNQRR